MTTPDCQHRWAIESTEGTDLPSGAPGQIINLKCTKCDEPNPIITNKTEAEIATLLETQAD